MRKFLKFSLIVLLVFSTALIGCSTGENEEGNATPNENEQEKEKIVIGVTPWTSTLIPSHIVNILLTDMGYDVKLQDADVGIVFAGLSRGDINVFMDSWLPDTHKSYMDEYGENIDDVAVSYYDGELGWVVPKYVDIDTVEGIKGNEDLFDGKIYGIDEGAGMTATSREMIEVYDLDLEYITSSETAMLTQATKNIANEEPVLFLGWRPHSMFANWDLKVIPDANEYFKTQEVHVLTSTDLKDRAPEAYEFLSNWSISVGDIESMILGLDEGAKPEQLAQEWIDNNQDKVNEMLGK